MIAVVSGEAVKTSSASKGLRERLRQSVGSGNDPIPWLSETRHASLAAGHDLVLQTRSMLANLDATAAS